MPKDKKGPELRAQGEDAFFVASNSANGFCSYYEECFGDAKLSSVFIIKGGPGTGKSRFMRDVSDYAMEHGWVRRMIYCSSDADSLDGVILQRGDISIAMLDGTAPHVYEPKFPGVREELINLGAFWDGEQLRSQVDEIRRYQEQKSKGYRMAYRYLSAYGAVYRNLREVVAPYVRKKAIAEYAKKLMSQVPDGTGFESTTALLSSVGMSGVVRFDTYAAQAKKLYLIEDCRETAGDLMAELYRLAAEKQLRVRVSRNPILPDILDGLFLTDSGVAFVTGDREFCLYPHRGISMRRFLRVAEMRSVKEIVNFNQRMLRALLDETMEQMRTVRQSHFALESIYSSAMNFSEKEIFTKNFCNRLFDLQNP